MSALVETKSSQNNNNTLQPQAQPRVPSDNTFRNAAKIALAEDKPIMLDYWAMSLGKGALIGIKDLGEGNNEKLLVKTSEDYTSPIAKIYRSNEELIVVTENSIYLVHKDIPTQRIN